MDVVFGRSVSALRTDNPWLPCASYGLPGALRGVCADRALLRAAGAAETWLRKRDITCFFLSLFAGGGFLEESKTTNFNWGGFP